MAACVILVTSGLDVDLLSCVLGERRSPQRNPSGLGLDVSGSGI